MAIAARVLMIAAAASMALVAVPALADGPSGDRVVSYIEVLQDGALIVETDGAWDNPEGCAHPHRFIVPAENPFLNRHYALVLTGFGTGNSVWAWFSGCRTMGWGEEYPVAKNVAIRLR